MKYFKNITDDYIESISTGTGETEITESEYNEIFSAIRTYPRNASDGKVYMLRADSLAWELVDAPEEPEPSGDDEIGGDEALEIILGGGK